MTRVIIMGLALGGLMLGGCAVGKKPPYGAKQDTLSTTTSPENQAGWSQPQSEGARREYPQIEVERSIWKYIVVGDVAENRGEVMSVTVPIRLKSDAGEFTRIQYQFMFFDDKGVPLRVQPDWRYLRLESRRQEFISATSNDTASKWRLRIQLNR
ncbi:MAG: hypothetical protein HBSAPP03_24830 [Phycisphaerae bacterium]|nr:MAG: hypothetical protein HBSAPP03_24830 [Phycisphaerae bacterium]